MTGGKAGPGDHDGIDVPACLEAACTDLLVAQCRLAALEDAVPFEDLIFCRRLIAAASAEIARLARRPAN